MGDPEASAEPLRCQVCGGSEHDPYTRDPQGNFARCRGCGLIVRIALRDGDDPGDHSETDERYFEMYRGRRERKIWSDSRRLQALLHYVRDVEGRPVQHLDLGCGLGSMLEAGVSRLGLQSTGVDIADYAIDFCRERGLDARRGSLADTGLEGESFDLVTAMNVLEHIPRTEDGLREVHRVLRPGGVVGLIVPNGGYLKAHLLRGSYRNYHGKRARFHRTYHNRATMLRLVERASFRPLRYPWAVTTRMRNPFEALGELAVCLPRILVRQLMYVARMQRELFIIARRI